MSIGKVKWFNNAKGYGFVLLEDEGEDLFAHYSAIQMDGYRTLKAGQDVEFEVAEGPKGLHAVNIRLSDTSDVEPPESMIGLEGEKSSSLADISHIHTAADREAPSSGVTRASGTASNVDQVNNAEMHSETHSS